MRWGNKRLLYSTNPSLPHAQPDLHCREVLLFQPPLPQCTPRAKQQIYIFIMLCLFVCLLHILSSSLGMSQKSKVSNRKYCL